MEAKIKIGEEGVIEAAIKELYLRLIFAYKEIIAENPKKPGIIPGVYHRIVLNCYRPREQIVRLR